MANDGIETNIELVETFTERVEGQANWAIRYGAEPVDTHMTGLSNERGEKREPKWYNITADPGGNLTNHNYIDIGTIDADGQFVPHKRIQALALDENLTMLDPANSRLFGFVIDGKYNTFEQDDMVYGDDPHHARLNEFQHADVKDFDLPDLLLGDDPTDDYTRVVFQGSERDVLQLYATMVSATIEINNQDPEFGMLGDWSWKWFAGEAPNSNTFNAEIKEVIDQAASHLGFEIGEHNPWGWDIGATAEMLETSAPVIATWDSIDYLRNYVDTLEKATSEQWRAIQDHGIDTDLDTDIPVPPTQGLNQP